MAQPCNLLPIGPLSDGLFPFNQECFLQIRNYQDKDLAFLDCPAVKLLVGTGDLVGGTATAITQGVGGLAQTASSTAFGLAGAITAPLGGAGLFGGLGQVASAGIGLTQHTAEQLVDPTRVAREHYHYSMYIKNNLPPAINLVDQAIHDFSYEIGHQSKELYENLATKGVQIIAGLEARLAVVLNALAQMIAVLTANHINDNLKIGHEKYLSIKLDGNPQNSLGDISAYLPKVLETCNTVKVAFENIGTTLATVKVKVNAGITDPNQVFGNKREDVEIGWQNFEARRKTMTYLPYKY